MGWPLLTLSILAVNGLLSPSTRPYPSRRSTEFVLKSHLVETNSEPRPAKFSLVKIHDKHV